MAKKKVAPKLYLGGRKNLRGEKQVEAETNRQERNRSHKARFKDGSQDARNGDGLVTVTSPKGTMRSPAAQAMSKRAAVKRAAPVEVPESE
jgi:hypothetical protein